MKLGTTSGAYVERYGLKNGLRRMRELGYECMDYQGFVDTESPLFTASLTKFEETLTEIRRACDDAGIAVSQAHGPWRYPPRDATEEERAERLEKMLRSVYGSALLGCENLVIHPIMPFGADSDPEPERMWEINLEFMRKLADGGREHGVTVCFENMPMTALAISPPEAILRFVKELDHPFFKICLDTGHCSALGLSAGDAVRLIGKEYLKVMHVHDNDGKADYHWLPYTGVIDWDDFSDALAQIGFEGTVSLETQVSDALAEGEERRAADEALVSSLRRIARR